MSACVQPTTGSVSAGAPPSKFSKVPADFHWFPGISMFSMFQQLIVPTNLTVRFRQDVHLNSSIALEESLNNTLVPMA